MTRSTLQPRETMRVLGLARKLLGRSYASVVHDEAGATLTAETVPLERFSTVPPTDDCDGNVAAMALYAGESVASIHRAQPAADIVRELSDGAEALLRAVAPD